MQGVAYFFGRAALAAVPLLSTLEQPIPMIVFCVSTICSGVLTCFFKEPPRDAHQTEKKSKQPKMKVTKVQPFVELSAHLDITKS